MDMTKVKEKAKNIKEKYHKLPKEKKAAIKWGSICAGIGLCIGLILGRKCNKNE